MTDDDGMAEAPDFVPWAVKRRAEYLRRIQEAHPGCRLHFEVDCIQVFDDATGLVVADYDV